MQNHRSFIENAWEQRTNLQITDDFTKVIISILKVLGEGQLRIAEKINGEWIVHQWLKKAIVLAFRALPNQVKKGDMPWFDKVPLKFQDWEHNHFHEAGIRVIPGALVRESAYIGRNVILMSSFVNAGAYIDEGTMIDTWALVGSCAQIGKNCHISASVVIGGVLEPLQANPVIIEDNCFIGAGSQVTEGVIVEQGSVISMGVSLGASTKIIDQESGEIFQGRVPAYSVVVPGTLPSKNPTGLHLACAVIIKRVDEQTRQKTSINELLRY